MNKPMSEESPARSGTAVALNPAPGDPALAVALSRTEIDASIATARAFPRSLRRAVDTMMTMATYNPVVAEACIYSLPRGGKQIRGPSIRFAEIIRHAWGNSRDGARVTFVDRIERNVECEAMFHDLETNISTSASVRRTIELKRGKHTIDLDMIQIAGAAGMSIARRNAILGGIPRFVWEPVMEAVERVIRGDEKTLGERRDGAVSYWAKTGVPTDRLLKAIERDSVEAITLDDLVTMTGWRTALKAGETSLDEIFPPERPAAQAKTLDERLTALGEPSASSNAPAEAAGDATPPEHPPAADDPKTISVGRPSGLSPEHQGRAKGEAGADPSDAGKPASPLNEAGKAEEALPTADGDSPAGNGKTAAKGARKPSQAQSDKLAGLIAVGDAKAAEGRDPLSEWLDNLPGDLSALATPDLVQRWEGLADGK